MKTIFLKIPFCEILFFIKEIFIFFLESICDNPQLIETNILDVKVCLINSSIGFDCLLFTYLNMIQLYGQNYMIEFIV